MGNVFCEHIGEALPPPVFHLGVENGVIKDITGGVNITNYGVHVHNDATEGAVMDFHGGCVDTKALALVKNLWRLGSFAIKFKIKVINAIDNSFVFGSNRATDTNCPFSLFFFNNVLYLVYSPNWNNRIKTNMLDLNVWHDVVVNIDMKNISLFVDNVKVENSAVASGDIRDYPFLIGGQTNKSGVGNINLYINSLISYFKIYDRPIK